MTPERWQRASGVFLAALDRSAHERTSWVREQCAGDSSLADMVLAMIERDHAQDDRKPAVSSGLLDAALDDRWLEGHRVGPFAVIRRIGVGGMGEVYLAERVDGIVSQQVAIKRLHSNHAHPELKRRFMLERRILARLEHPLIARFLDAGSDQHGRPWAAMEYVEGQPLDQYATSLRLGLNARLELFNAIADTVAYAHRQLIVHRDIKPGNVMVDAQGRPRLLDFGIAKLLGGDDAEPGNEATRIDFRAFSLNHASPEQLRGMVSSVSCDIYALGVLLYELLTGKRPLQLEGLAYGEAERAVLEELPPPPSRRVAWREDWPIRPGELRGDLDQIVLHALEKRPEDRYPTVEAMRADLEAVLKREPISLRRRQRIYRLRRFLRRHRVPVTLGALVAAGVVTGATTFVLQAGEVQRERDHAEAALRLLGDAFTAANPLNIQGAEITARQILDTSRSDLARRMREAPGRYTELAMTLAEVELAIGRPNEAARLVDAGLLDDQSGRRMRNERAALLRGRIALANSDSDAFEQQLSWAMRHELDNQPDWRLLRARHLAAHGQRLAAIRLLEELVAELPLQGDGDMLALEARQLLAQTYRNADRREEALALLDQTLQEQRQVLPTGHPKILVTRLYRLDPLRTTGRAEEAVAEAEELLPEIERAFGAASVMAAATQMSLASILNTLGRAEEALAMWPRAIATWTTAAGATHPNTQRARFNFANLLEREGDIEAAEAQLHELVRQSTPDDTLSHHFALNWSLHLAELQLRRGKVEAALGTTLDTFRRAAPEGAESWMRERYASLVAELQAAFDCPPDRAAADQRCDELDRFALRLTAADGGLSPPPDDT